MPKLEVELELADLPKSLYKRFKVSPQEPRFLLHQILCEALHEGNSEAMDALSDYVVNIGVPTVKE